MFIEGHGLTVGTRGELVRINPENGAEIERLALWPGEDTVVLRLSLAPNGNLVVTSTRRTPWDDEERVAPLWDHDLPLARRRTFAGEAVLVDRSLRVVHRIPPHRSDFVLNDDSPVVLADGRLALGAYFAIELPSGRRLKSYGGWVAALNPEAGRYDWVTPIDHNPVLTAAGPGVFDGIGLLGAAGGQYIWTDIPRLASDLMVPAVCTKNRLLLPARGDLIALSLDDGRVVDSIPLGTPSHSLRVTMGPVLAGDIVFLGVEAPGEQTRLLGIELGYGLPQKP